MSQRTSIFDLQGFERLRRDRNIDPHQVRQLRNRLLKHFDADAEVLANFPASDRVTLHCLEVFRRCDSELDGASKLLFRTQAGMLIESVVLRIATGRTTLCVSSQVGCAAACEFCATGKMGVAQDLSSGEILDQVLQAGQLLASEGRKIRNLVFMGMGEPFHNEENLYASIEALTAAQLFHHSPAKILISTVGIPEAMIRCARRFPAVNQALSLHSARQETREQIIPLAKKYPLEQLRQAIVEINRIQQKPVMVEYLMLAGVNDTNGDAAALIAWLRDLDVHVNLIPYNPIEDAPHLVGTERPERDAFAGLLKQAGLQTTIRYSLGADIDAACGQLVKKENRAIARQAKRSDFPSGAAGID